MFCRVNTIMPRMLDTPMALDAWAEKLAIPHQKIRAQRNSMVPLRANHTRFTDFIRAPGPGRSVAS
jgi:hypothetical protein